MRLFAAIKFSPEIEKVLTEVQNELKSNGITGNYTDCRNLHLTLAFIGEYNAPDKVMEALRNIKFEPFKLSLEENMGNFGDILWLGVKKDSSLMSLDKEVRKALKNFNIPYDPKPFKPHITLIRKAKVYDKNGTCIKSLKNRNLKMTVENISLIHSHRENGKLIYTETGRAQAVKNDV